MPVCSGIEGGADGSKSLSHVSGHRRLGSIGKFWVEKEHPNMSNWGLKEGLFSVE